ncbi:MAG: PIN domain-containing protein [Coriobacteriales bacterium]|jgi:predicted nucleic acid-binding protein
MTGGTVGRDSHQLKVLVDTNVWVDNYCAWHAGHEAARAFLAAACRGHAQLLYPVHCIKDFFYVLGHEFRRAALIDGGGTMTEEMARAAEETVWGCVDNLRGIACAVGADETDVWLACKYRPLSADLGDGLVLAAAERAHVDYLVTNDARLAAHATVAALTPELAASALALPR